MAIVRMINTVLIVALAIGRFFLLVNTITHPQDTEALKAFNNTIKDPFGKLWNWKGEDPCGDRWHGVFCTDPDNEGHTRVSEIHLMHHNLTGNIDEGIGTLANLTILDLMWNNITGPIPKSLGNLQQLEILLLSGNKLQGQIPESLGNLSQMNRLQIDENSISGPIPKSFQHLESIKHLHMNNNSLNGIIPEELSKLQSLIHILVDNNNLSAPPKSLAPNLSILQLDNNNFTGAEIPSSYAQTPSFFKLSMRNCSLQGQIPDFGSLTNLSYLDLSHNGFTGSVSNMNFSKNMTSIDLSFNNLKGPIPQSFGELPNLQALSLRNNNISGSIPNGLIHSAESSNTTVLLDLQYNSLSPSDGDLSDLLKDSKATIWLYGSNSYCDNDALLDSSKYASICSPHEEMQILDNRQDSQINGQCDKNTCIPNTELHIPLLLKGKCICVLPITIGLRLKSPLFTFFTEFINQFQEYIAQANNLTEEQVYVDSYNWEKGPRLSLVVKLYPQYTVSRYFSQSEVDQTFLKLSRWQLPENTRLGPLEFLSFSYNGTTIFNDKRKNGMSGLLIAIVIVCTVAATSIATAIIFWCLRCYQRAYDIKQSSLNSTPEKPVKDLYFKVTGVKSFAYKELSDATNLFSDSMKVGQGGYGKVYRGELSDGQIVAIKRAQVGSLQGANEFRTEIEMLSRVHHRNLVSLAGYCNDNDEQMLVYEYMANGTLRDNLTRGLKRPLSFATRVRIALGAARGILYLHTEANPPIFHRDIKTTNILLDKDKNAKVADFGLSKLAPVPGIDGSEPGHVSTVVKGTPGYLDPEYFLTCKLTDKSDVYSFGVVLLEILTAMQPIANGKNIVREVNWAYENGTALQIMDPNMGAYPSEALEPFIRLALDCCKEKTEDRPSMAEVVRDLEYIWQYAHDSESDDFELDSKDYQACKISNANKSRMEQFNLSANSICRDTSIENDSIHFRDPVGIVVGR